MWWPTLLAVVAVWALQEYYWRDSGRQWYWTHLAADPDAAYRGVSAGGHVLGLCVAAGALLSGGLVALGPVGPVSALTTPVVAAVAFQLAWLVALVMLLVETRPAAGRGALRSSLGAAPRMVGQALGLLRRSRVLAALVAVELFWASHDLVRDAAPVPPSRVVGEPTGGGAARPQARWRGSLGRRRGARPAADRRSAHGRREVAAPVQVATVGMRCSPARSV